MLYQKRAADTLERLAEEGNDYFYHGELAEKMCKIVQEAGGVMTRKDLEHYQVRWQEPARGSYRGFEIAASPPPDNGGTHIIEMLNMVELLDLEKLGPPTEAPEILLQMVRIANEVYEAGARQNDPETHPLPLETILSKEYAKIRFELLQMGNPNQPATPPPPVGSNHITVADEVGNVATILHSCMSMPWSNGLFVDGISICAAGAHFFRVMPKLGHRISAYVAPNIVLKNGKPILASGSPSVGLLQNVLQNTVNILDFGIPIDESVLRPRFGGRSLTTPGATMIEVDIDEKVRKAVAAKGIDFDVVNPWNWHHGAFEGIYVDPDTGMQRACGDPRRCSKAEGV
jgi:gamma-glutamyltranspeptidase/glutathione hydrolase